jgi:hypothetical protein
MVQGMLEKAGRDQHLAHRVHVNPQLHYVELLVYVLVGNAFKLHTVGCIELPMCYGVP